MEEKTLEDFEKQWDKKVKKEFTEYCNEALFIKGVAK
jgi:hypothetical protein